MRFNDTWSHYGHWVSCMTTQFYICWSPNPDTRLHIHWAVSLMTTNGHFSLPQEFVWVCVGSIMQKEDKNDTILHLLYIWSWSCQNLNGAQYDLLWSYLLCTKNMANFQWSWYYHIVHFPCDQIHCELMSAVLSRFLAHAPIAEKMRIEK